MTDEPYDGPGNASDLPLFRSNDIFYLLSQHRKRAIVLALAMAPWGRVHLRQLADILCLLEGDTEHQCLSTQQVTSVRSNLKRSHLPPLVAAGVIEWSNDEPDVLTPGPGFGAAVQTLWTGGYSLGHPPEQIDRSR